MKFIQKYIIPIGVVVFVLLLYRNWFTKTPLTATDFPFVYPMQLADYLSKPYAWSNIFGNGLGGRTIDSLNLDTYLHVMVRLLVFTFHLSWNAVSRIIFFWPFLIGSFLSSLYFCQTFLKDRTKSFIGALLYTSNTYILMLAGGGQVGLFVAYSFIPLVFAAFHKRRSALFILAAAVVSLFDLRFSFLTALAIALYILITVDRRQWLREVRFFIVPACVISGIHAFWLIPTVFGKGLSLPPGYGSGGWLSYLSWAEFSKTISLLHPNWPENIFGKTYFMRPEFFILPMLAYASLLFIRPKQQLPISQRQVLYFIFLGIVGAFLAKGINGPFGGINNFLFLHAPLFNGFRDPTKFYVFVCLSYSILVPYTLKALDKRFEFVGRYGVGTAVFFVFWIFTLLPVLSGHGTGTFAKTVVPEGYETLAMYEYGDQSFGRVLAMPWQNRYFFQSENHPVVSARDIFQTTDIGAINDIVRSASADATLRALAIRYVVVPEDSANEIFLLDRKYDRAIRATVTQALDSVPYLEKLKGYGSLDVYENTHFTGMFYTVLPNWDINSFTSRKINPVQYEIDDTVTIPATPSALYVSMAYDPNWRVWDGSDMLRPQQTSYGTMIFTRAHDVTDQLMLYYTGQSFVDIGIYISLGTLLCVALYIIIACSKRNRVPGVVALCIVITVGLYIVSSHRVSDKNVLTDQYVWKSTEWNAIGNPLRGDISYVSRYGGSEIRFTTEQTKSISVTVSSPNNEPKIQGINVFVDGSIYTKQTPLHNARLVIPVSTGRHSVIIRHWCAGTLWPCDLAVNSILVDPGAHVSPPQSVPKKTLAVFGDSISVSFGQLNYWYEVADRLGYQLHNASIFGSSIVQNHVSDWSLDRLQRDIIRYRPNVLIIFLGTNDLAQDSDIFSANYTRLIETVQNNSPETRILSVGLLRRKDIPDSRVALFNSIIESIDSARHIPYISTFDWLEYGDLQDVVHPSPQSQPKLANYMYEAILPMLQK